MKEPDTKWYAVCTNPRAEKKAFKLLQSKGIEVYLPLQKKLKQWSDRKKWVEEVLIPSYLFVKIGVTDLTTILSTPGVSRFIYFSGKPCSIPDKQIAALRLLLASESEVELTNRTFKKGDSVDIIAGTLKGMQGELVELYSQKKLLIRIGNTGHSLLVQVPTAFLVPSIQNRSELDV